VAVDWQELMLRERNAAATTHTTAPINHTRPSPRKHSPDGATRSRKQTSDYSYYLKVRRSQTDVLPLCQTTNQSVSLMLHDEGVVMFKRDGNFHLAD